MTWRAVLSRLGSTAAVGLSPFRVHQIVAAAGTPSAAGRPLLEFRAFCARRRLPASSAPQLERAWDAWQAERYRRGKLTGDPATPETRSGHANDHPRATAHTRAVQETGCLSGADGSVVTSTP